LHAARLVQGPQYVVERHEVGRAFVHDREADDRPSGLPAPLDLSVLGAQAVEEPILRAEIQPVAADEDLVGGAAEPPLPDNRARVDAHGDDVGVPAGEVDVFAAERGARVRDRSQVASPQQRAVGGTEGQQLFVRGGHEQPAVVPHRRNRDRVRQRQFPRGRAVGGAQRRQAPGPDHEHEVVAGGGLERGVDRGEPEPCPGREVIRGELVAFERKVGARRVVGGCRGEAAVECERPHGL